MRTKRAISYNWLLFLFFRFYLINQSISFSIKDYQIDHFLENSTYPIVMSPLSDSLDQEEYEKNEIPVPKIISFGWNYLCL